MHRRASGVVRHGSSPVTTAHRAGVQFGTPVPGPPVGQVGSGAVDGLGDVAQVLLGVEISPISMAPGKCSAARFQPRGAVADDDAGRRVSAVLPRMDRSEVGSTAGDRGVVADRPAVPHGAALCVAPFGRPHGGQPRGSWPNRRAAWRRPSTSVGRTGTPVPSSPRYIAARSPRRSAR